jgi:signal transduction histidine kinase
MATSVVTTPYMDSRSARKARLSRGSLALIALCLTLGLVETLQQHVGMITRGDDIPFLRTLVNNFGTWLPALPLVPIIVLLAERWPLDLGGWKRNLPLHLLAMLLFVFLHQYASAWIFAATATQPITFQFILVKTLTFRFAIDALVYWTGVGITWGARVSQAAREREQAAARLEATLAEARLAALRDQLNPHFLFNTLNAISTLALREDRYAVVGAIGALSDLLRRSLDTRQVQEVSLAEEIELANRFLEIQQIRFGDRLTIVRHVPEQLLPAAVPVMLLQPLLENAFQHGVARVTGPISVAIAAREEDGRLILEVIDTGPGFGTTTPVEGIGIQNTRERLRHLYQDTGVLHLLPGTAETGSGTIARATLPLRFLPPPPDPAGTR